MRHRSYSGGEVIYKSGRSELLEGDVQFQPCSIQYFDRNLQSVDNALNAEPGASKLGEDHIDGKEIGDEKTKPARRDFRG